jgi:N-acetylmuramoyl-L-alanine amidase
MRRRPNGLPSSLVVRVLAFVRRVALLGVALSAAGLPAVADPDGYVPLGSFALRLRLGFERDASSGVVICEGNGLRITAGAGLSMVLLNGEGIPLQRPVLEENGIVYIPSEVAGQIEARAVQASAAARAVPASPRVASAPLPAPPRAVPCTPPDAGRAAGPLRPPVHPFTVVLDPGHGGEHTGAKGRSGVVEKMVNLDVARRLQRQLEAAGAKVVLTHSTDVDFSPDVREDLRRRYEIGNRTVPDLYLSIHSNWAEDTSARGFEVFVRRDRATDDQEKRVDSSRIRIPAERLGGVSLGDTAVERMLHDLVIERSSEGSLLLAREIERRFAQGLRTENRGIKERDFQVIRWSQAPAVLVELEFLSNSRAERDLGSPEHRELLAKLLAESIAVFRARWAPGSDRPAAGDRTGLAARRAAYAQR